jgi:hypothetical protein
LPPRESLEAQFAEIRPAGIKKATGNYLPYRRTPYMPREGRTPLAIELDEKNHVEEPFLKQLEELKWEVIRLDMKAQKPEESFRDLFIDVVMLPKRARR